MVTSPYEWKILKRDEKHQTINQSCTWKGGGGNISWLWYPPQTHFILFRRDMFTTLSTRVVWFWNTARFGSARGLLEVRSESILGGSLCALMREANLALLLPPISPAPCIFQKHCPAEGSLSSGDQKHNHVQDSQAIPWRNINKITRMGKKC